MEEKNIRPPLSIPEAARLLGVSDQVTRKAILRGELDAFRIGRAWRVRPESVERLVHGDSEAA